MERGAREDPTSQAVGLSTAIFSPSTVCRGVHSDVVAESGIGPSLKPALQHPACGNGINNKVQHHPLELHPVALDERQVHRKLYLHKRPHSLLSIAKV